MECIVFVWQGLNCSTASNPISIYYYLSIVLSILYMNIILTKSGLEFCLYFDIEDDTGVKIDNKEENSKG